MLPRIFLLACLSFAPSSSLLAAELRVFPAEVTLSGPNRVQQLLAVDVENSRAVKDHPSGVVFRSSDDTVAKVDRSGRVTAIGDGNATITAAVGDRSTTAMVKVSGLAKPAAWSFRNHVLPVLTRTGCNSGACHGALAGKGGMKLSLRGYDPDSDWFVLTRQALGRRVDLNTPTESLMLKKAARLMPHGGGTRIIEDDDNFLLMSEWIQAGAKGPQGTDPTLVQLEVFPTNALLKPKDTLRVTARAVYSDGSTEDVSRWARFGSSEEQVAGVDEDGVVTVAGSGEAAITVTFGTKVSVLTVTSPFPNKAVVVSSPRNNYIDEFVLKKLELLRLTPSAPCSDTEFARRAYLDTCGILPPPEEARAFLADTDPKKRDKLIARLLDHPAYTDYWAYRWSEMLLVSSRKLPQPAMWAYYRKVRQSVADNMPWDQFARELLTSSGSTFGNGGGNYFVLHKDVSELAEATAVTFLGMSIGCAKCHNHPLEKWTQDQYWAFANLFSRVGLKNGERAGEVFVRSRLDGEALHPRTALPVPPTPFDSKPLPLDSSIDRRAYFADWLTARDNPYFARAVVNRVWRNFMGRGLIEAEDDMRVSNPPTNAELLDALAADFVKNKYDMKHLMRTILQSAAYQRSSQSLPENAADDRFYSRYLVRRLPAEVILDAYSDVTAVPTQFNKMQSAAGDSVTATAVYPAGTRAIQLPDSLLLSRFLEAFGRAERVATCSCERTSDASVSQALHLNNGVTLNDKLRDQKSIVSNWIAARLTEAEIVDRVFLAALTRFPTADEKKRFTDLLTEAAKEGEQSRREAIEDFLWAVLTGREFLFNH